MLEVAPFAELRPYEAPRAPGLDEGLFEASADCVKVLGLDGEVLAMNGNGRCLMEIDNFEAVRGRPWVSLWPPEHRRTLEAAMARARAGGVARFCSECPTAKGTVKWWEVVISPVFDDAGEPIRLLSVSRDITEERRIKAENALLAQELAHRIKNMFAVVDGVIALSSRVAPPDAQTFAAELREQFAALGRAVAYISPPELRGPEDARTHSLHGLLHVLLEPYGDIDSEARRIKISGDDLPVGSNATSPVALFANELATNALKYGALHGPEGWVEVTTRRTGEGLDLVWEEHGQGVPAPRALAPGSGFGSTLVDNAVRHLDGHVIREWGPKGLVVRIHLSPERLAI